MAKVAVETIPLDKLRIDGGTQQRALNDAAVGDYADRMRDGSEAPPGVAFLDGRDHWLADGFHRWHACRKAGRDGMAVEVRSGTQRDAVLYSLTDANRANGVPLTNAEKAQRVEALLKDEEWGKWSDPEIARSAGVSREMVRRHRSRILQPLQDAPPPDRKVKRGGKTYTMNTAKVGGKRKDKATPAPLPAPAEQAAADVDTVRRAARQYTAAEPAAPLPPEPEPTPGTPTVPWAEFDAAADPWLDDLDKLIRQAPGSLGVHKHGDKAGRWSKFISWDGTVAALKAVRAGIEAGRPAELSDKPPGYLPAHQAKARDAIRAARAGAA